MNIERLIVMANQIGDFFESYPDVELAKKSIAAHIKNFWALKMRQQLVTHVLEKQGSGLHAMVTEAVREHQATLA
ncbi:MAG: formate dehydrogenase [Betaproteobacteria bacterium HGW-Betaproteobacteria-2]|jgi:formate dehydrogenase subunit delta|nr:MAG: formate dehydrogenase [Betaproteobacteria bacterium HGW-Betaproteobacteria-2]PKO94060.1 MAG: formate dehydrogenase [Betaproteobacteria bacterium HGW-Betaproteobacteria-1]